MTNGIGVDRAIDAVGIDDSPRTPVPLQQNRSRNSRNRPALLGYRAARRHKCSNGPCIDGLRASGFDVVMTSL